ncbi:MAG: S8 family serine peptidase [Limisphaerales bacterium]
MITSTFTRDRSTGLRWSGGFTVLLGLASLALVLAGEAAEGLMPKAETGVPGFLEQHPEYDGRGVVVAVFDTGIDPGAAGLQRTPDGRVKIIDVVDATGSGDVDTSTVREAEDGELAGLSGRALRVGSDWSNPTGKYHVGLKPAFEIFPDGLVSRIRGKRAERMAPWRREMEVGLRRQLEAWDEAHRSPTEEGRKERKDLEERLIQLESLAGSLPDPGPLLDCVVFHDGEVWRAVIDTDEDGDLADERLMTDYHREYEWASFGEDTMLNFAVNIYEEGRLLSIVADSGMHGTHVAGIVGAYYPESPELNGMAPGAQLVSVKIGDTRLGGMETSTGFERGLAVVRRHGCDIINLSYGEPTTRPNAGSIPELLTELVREDGVIFISSAGNAGPAMSTVGAPGGTTSALIGVGAYVSPAMMENGYSMRSGLSETHYTWTSRGPTADGDWGVNISAPGGAISPVPTWTLQRSMMANGTSMASPNAAGCVALLVSGLKAEGTPYTPWSIRLALENTAREVAGMEVFTQGRGLIDVVRAFDWLREAGLGLAEEPALEVRIPSLHNARGIYLREPEMVRQPLAVSVQVSPVFPEDEPNPGLVGYERRYRLESTADWVDSATSLLLVHGGRSFDLKVHPEDLPHGVHTAEVLGYDQSCGEEAGPAFRVPVTVVRGMEIEEQEGTLWRADMHLEPGDVQRLFYQVPAGATWAEFRLTAGELEEPHRLVLHAQQVLDGELASKTGINRRLSFESNETSAVSFGVAAGHTLEVCLASYWSTQAAGDFEGRLEFYGVAPESEVLFLDGGARATASSVTAGLRETRLQVRGQLNRRLRTVVPLEAKLTALDAGRDALPDNRQIHQLVLQYGFRLDADTTVTPRFPALNGRLYDGEFGSQLWMIFDAQKKWITTDDGWEPGPVRLEKGDYALRFHLRHAEAGELKKLEHLPMVLEENLTSPIGLVASSSADALLRGSSSAVAQSLGKGERAAFWLAPSDPGKLTAAGAPGDVLAGSIQYEAGGAAPSYPVFASIPPAAKSSKGDSPKSSGDELTPEEEYERDLREWKVARLQQLGGADKGDAFEALYSELLAEDAEQLELHEVRLHWIDNDDRKARLASVVEAANAVLARIDTAAVSAGLGRRADPEDSEATSLVKELNKKKSVLIDALYRKGRALAWMELPEEGESDEGTEPPFESDIIEKLFEANYAELMRWVEPEDSRVILLSIRREWRHGRLGEALRLLQVEIGRQPASRKLLEKRIRLLDELGWGRLADRERMQLLVRYPTSYALF